MTSHEFSYQFDDPVPIEFISPDSGRIPLAVQGLDVGPGVILHTIIRPEVFERVLASRWMHLDGEPTDVDWDPDVDITVTLGLIDALANSQRIGDGEPLLMEIGRRNGASDLSSVDAWCVHEALQTLSVPGDPTASLQIGLRTRWADPSGA